MNTELLGKKPVQDATSRRHSPWMCSTSPATQALPEKHYRVGELAGLWGLGRETVTKDCQKDEPVVIKIWQGRKKAHTTYSVPESVVRRIHTRLLNVA